MKKLALARSFLAFLALSSLSSVTPAAAQAYPARELKTMCGFNPGSGADVLCRFFSDKLSGLAGKPVLVENRGGMGGVLGAEAAARARPDGYTVLITPGGSTHTAAAHLYKKLPYDPIKDFAPVTTLCDLSFVLVVDPARNLKTVADLTGYLKQKGGKANYGASTSTGIVAAELYKAATGLEVTPVQFRGAAPQIGALQVGDIDFLFTDTVTALEQSRAGKLQALAVTSAKRISAASHLPTMREIGFANFDLTSWWSVHMPRETPQPIVDKLVTWFNQIIAMEETKKFFNTIGAEPMPGTPESLTALIVEDTKRWAEYVKVAKLEPQ